VTIDIDQLSDLVATADGIFLSAKAEKTLLKLLEIQKQVEDAIDGAKKKLEETALKINPNFQSIQADNVKVYYRAFGSRYFIEEENLSQVPAEMYEKKVITKYSANAKEIEKFVKEKGGLPFGVKEAEREKQLVFGLKKTNEKE